MNYLTNDAAHSFLTCSRNEFFSGIISWSQLLNRLVVLKDMCSANNPSGIIASRVLQIEDWEFTDEWPEEGDLQSTQSEDENLQPNIESSIEFRSYKNEDEIFLCFLAGTHTGLTNWEFHQYDDDFFPSIPHGHWKGNKQPKLDAYQGWIYNGSKQIRREPRKNIISLWNDQKFRKFAQIAIGYYIEHHPKYSGWRVKNPKRLPRF